MSDEKKTSQELSMTEKRVLMALVNLGGKGTPEQLQEAVMPDVIAELSKTLKESLNSAFTDTDLNVGDNQRARIIEQLLQDCNVEDEKEMEVKVVSTLAGALSNQILSLDVPLQRNVLGKLLGECIPSVMNLLKKVGTEGTDTGFVSQVEVMNSCSWLRAKGLVEMSEKLERYYPLSSKRGKVLELPERRALKVMKKAH
jgi:hypothetical protein